MNQLIVFNKAHSNKNLIFNKYKVRAVFLLILINHLAYSQANENNIERSIKVNNIESVNNNLNNTSIPLQFCFGGKYSKYFINVGVTRPLKTKWNYTLGGIFYNYSYSTQFYQIIVGHNSTTYMALYGQVAHNYLNLRNDKLKLLGSLQIELSNSRVTHSNQNTSNVLSIIEPVIFFNHEIDYRIFKNIDFILTVSVGYGNGLIKKGVDSSFKNDFRTDRDNGYGEIRYTYGLRFFL